METCAGAVFMLLSQQTDKFCKNLYGQVHGLYGDVLIRPVECVAACSDIRAGKPFETQLASVRAATDRQDQRLCTGTQAGFFGMVNEMHVGSNDLSHVGVLLCDRQRDAALAPFFI